MLIAGGEKCVRECEENVSRMRIEGRIIHVRSFGWASTFEGLSLRERRGCTFRTMFVARRKRGGVAALTGR